MATRASARQRYPEHNKPLKFVKKYEEYAQFEATFTDVTHPSLNEEEIDKKVEELKTCAFKTIEALKQKQPVRIPEMAAGDTSISAAQKKSILDEIQEKPLRKNVASRPGHFIRHFVYTEGEEDPRYNYEANQEDLLFITELKGSPFTVQEFEKLIDFLEKENKDDEAVKSFDYFRGPLQNLNLKQSMEDIEKVYTYWKEVRAARGGRGLLRKYWKAPDPSNPNPRITFRRSKEEKRTLRRTRRYDADFFNKMEIMRADLKNAKELLRLCKERERLKKLSTIAASIDFERTRGEVLAIEPDLSNYSESIPSLEALLKTHKKPETAIFLKPKEVLPLPKAPEPLAIENGNIVCNYETACILSSLIQRAAIAVERTQEGVPGIVTRKELTQRYKVEKKEKEKRKAKLELKRRKRRGRCGEIFIDRKIIHGVLKTPYTPDWDLPVEKPVVKDKPLNEEEDLPKNIEQQCFDGIYVFSDEEETLDDLDKKYKHINSGLKNFLRHRKRQAADKSHGTA